MSCCHLASVYQEIKEVSPSNAFVTSSSGSNEYFMVLRCPGVSLSDSYYHLHIDADRNGTSQKL